MKLEKVTIMRAQVAQSRKKDGSTFNYFEFQFAHGMRPKTTYNQATGQSEPVYDQNGQPMFSDDIQIIEYYGNDAQYMQQLNLQPGMVVNIELHSYVKRNSFTGRYETTFLVPADIKVVQMPQPMQQPQYQTQQPQAPYSGAPAPQQGGFWPGA